ncbi:C45 family autoproteolytic acyltransferase/hydolase [Salinisphaera hydrothermalis]|uniref:Putative choloylglycine hydrolase n=1 Tax=Salinisphaera hydrothermalis (strain C41B8) TaxID=1304275 RepID=A0A084INC7_SALHC|nr:C45 family peptidase [Salinisphaera hydrothermalis]KEZ78211.1 putative choloylglycine hydrolase [Salinisphaera hydrothermalis C41B8]
MTFSLQFDAVAEARPGNAWKARWHRSWPAYEAWWIASGGDHGPSRAACEAALAEHMPELAPVHARLTSLAGGGDRAARFLSTWCPPTYLGGCSLAARADKGEVRLLRNYDLSPELNEGLLLRTEWTGMPVMGMVEFLWGLSDGINGAGLSVALAYGGSGTVGEGFGITTILRYVLETCRDLDEALAVLARVPSHMAYNLVVADRHGHTCAVELHPGGGLTRRKQSIATNHQHNGPAPDRPGFTRTVARQESLEALFASRVPPAQLSEAFLAEPLFQRNYAQGFGTLFTTEYDPAAGAMTLHWPDDSWRQTLEDFKPGSRLVHYGEPAAETTDLAATLALLRPFLPETWHSQFDTWLAASADGTTDWAAFGRLFADGWMNPPAAERPRHAPQRM